MKICSKCRKNKSESEFGSNKYHTTGLNYYCKECRRSYDNQKYALDPESRRQKQYEFKKKNLAIIRKELWKLLSSSFCIDCGIQDPVAFEFDHIEDNKKYNVGAMMSNGSYSWDAIRKEIDKCEIVCANCHRHRTNNRLGWWRSSFTIKETDSRGIS